VSIKRTGHGASVSVRVSDSGVGVAKRSVTVSFGDGSKAGGHARLRHRYAHGGVFQIVVHARDKLGNQLVAQRPVSVR
jgi:hypothetical protein